MGWALEKIANFGWVGGGGYSFKHFPPLCFSLLSYKSKVLKLAFYMVFTKYFKNLPLYGSWNFNFWSCPQTFSDNYQIISNITNIGLTEKFLCRKFPNIQIHIIALCTWYTQGLGKINWFDFDIFLVAWGGGQTCKNYLSCWEPET